MVLIPLVKGLLPHPEVPPPELGVLGVELGVPPAVVVAGRSVVVVGLPPPPQLPGIHWELYSSMSVTQPDNWKVTETYYQSFEKVQQLPDTQVFAPVQPFPPPRRQYQPNSTLMIQ